ncbi:MAG: hypothetical protein NTW48_09610 [Chloroflexi bacterium]|nr:hypothetical protein [Chloroflexota bacterium]
MKKNYYRAAILVILAVASLLLGSLAGCECSASSASLSEATMCKNVDEEYRPIEKTDVFAPDTPEIFCSFKYSYAPEDTEIKAQFIYVQGEVQEVTNRMIAETSVRTRENSGYGYFSCPSPPYGWTRGDYVVKLFVDGKEKLTVPFTVQTGTATTAQPSGVPLANIFEEPGYGYTIRYPADWEYETGQNGTVTFMSKQGVQASGTLAILNQASTKIGGIYKDVDAVMNAAINQQKDEDAGAMIYEAEPFTYIVEGGQQVIGKMVTMEYTDQGRKARRQVAVIPHNIDGESFHIVIYYAPVDVFDANHPTVQAMLQSWILTE